MWPWLWPNNNSADMTQKSFACNKSGKSSFLTCHSFAEPLALLVLADVNPATITCHPLPEVLPSQAHPAHPVQLVHQVVKVLPESLVAQVPLVPEAWSAHQVPLVSLAHPDQLDPQAEV